MSHYVELSSHEQKLWLEWKRNPEKTYYVINLQYYIVGELDVEKVNKALASTITTYEALRTQFIESGLGVQKVIHEDVDGRFTILECKDKESAEQKRRAIISGNIDLLSFPLMQYYLIRFSLNETILVVRLPHILSDDASASLFLKTFSEFYGNDKDPVNYANIPTTKDYLTHSAIAESSEQLRERFAYWQNELRDFSPRVNFKVPSPHTKVKQKGKRFKFSLPQELIIKMKRLVEAEDTTLFNLMMSLYKILILKYFEDSDATIAYPVNARPIRENQAFRYYFGYCVNMMLMRLPINQSMSILEVLRNVSAKRKIERLNHGFDVSTLAQQILKSQGEQSALPFNTVISETVFSSSFSLKGKHITSVPTEFDESLTDLGFFYSPDDLNIFCAFEYNTAIFSEDFVARMGNNFVTLVTDAIEHLEKPIHKLEYLCAEEKDLLLKQCAGPKVNYPLNATLTQLFEAQVQRTPENVAIEFNIETITYKTLDDLSNRMANFLMEKGISAGDRVALAVVRSVEYIIAILGILKMGAIYIPVDSTVPAERIATVIDDSEPNLIFINEDAQSKFEKFAKKLVFIEVAPWRNCSPRHVTVGFDSSAIANIIYTSGSTGLRKGVCVPDSGLVNRMLWMQDAYKLTSDMKVLHKTPLTFDVAGWEIFWPLLTGAQLVIGPAGVEKDIAQLKSIIHLRKINVIHFVPTILDAFLTNCSGNECDSLQMVFCSGEALPIKLVTLFQRVSEAKLYNLYGPTEASIDVTAFDCSSPLTDQRVPIGKPIANTSIYIVDDQNNLVPIGREGELCIAGVGLAAGYLNQSELTAQKFVRLQFFADSHVRVYKTGDRAYLGDDGTIYYVGRIDHEIKNHGVRIHPSEIEKVINKNASVKESLVMMQNDQNEKN